MSKHLRFGKLLSLLAIMLTLSFAWSQAQNLSSQKQLLTFGFTVAANSGAQLGSDVMGTIDQTAHTVAITVPYQTVVTGLKASFTSSQFSNVFGGVTVPTLPRAVSGSSPALDYTTAKTWTVEAENFSYENYVVTVTKAAASAVKDMTSFTADIAKPWYGNCTPNGAILVPGTGTFSGTAVTFPVPYGANLDAITVYYGVSQYATGAPASGTAVDFDANNDGVPNGVSFVVTAQNGSTQTYTVTPVVGQPSYLDNLVSFAIPNSTSLVVNNTAQTITATVPYSATTIVPAWTISDYAKMYGSIPPAVPPVVGPYANICTTASYALAGATTVIEFWIQAEKPTEVSRYVLTVTKDAASTANTLTSISADYSKASTCGGISPLPTTGTLVGTIGASTVTFNVPFGVTSLTVSAAAKSALTTPATLVGTTLTNGSTIVITSESGVAKTYTVALVAAPASNGKTMLTFGFHNAVNNTWSFPVWGIDYAGVIVDNGSAKHVTVTVAWNTDLHDLRAYFTTSPFSCVSIAESDHTFTAQQSDVTVNDHSNTLTYVVTAEDGTQERYDVEVFKAAALTGNLITTFTISNLPFCPLVSSSFFSVNGTITGNNITVMVPNRSSINLASLGYTLVVSDGATVVGGLTGTGNFATPATFTVTSQSGLVNTYTVTVSKYNVTANPASRKQLTKYWFQGSPVNTMSVARVDGVINETAKTVEVWVPWGTNLAALKAGFELNDGLSIYTGGAVMTHSEDPQVVQASNVSPNDFTTPVAYTVFAEDCTTVEYFVTVHMTPDTSTGISAFTFAVTPCATGCPLVNRIDAYARRIYITVPYTVDISSLAPNSIVIAPAVGGLPAASVKPAVGVAQNWTNGPIKYTVTAPDGVTKADWMVYVTNPACQEHDILTFSLPFAQVAAADLVAGHGTPVTIDKVNHKIDVIVKTGTNLSRIYYERTLSCGATVCCVGGNCQDNFYLDFSNGGCHTCVVTAEDQTVKQDWTICVHEIHTAVPTVKTWSVMAYNCTDSVAVQSNEAGRVFIVNELALNKTVSPWVPATFKLADWTGTGATSVKGLTDARMGAWATVSAAQAGTPVYIQTNGLYSGNYWAFSVDDAGLISCISDQKLFLDICEVDIATVCSLRDQPDVWRYRLTEEVFVTYEENHTGGNWKFVQDATCGILIQDRLGALPVANYGRGAGLKNIVGMLDKSGVNMVFIPVCCYQPTKSSTGNVVTPISLTWDEFKANCYGSASAKSYESMLIKVTTPMTVTDGYYARTTWPYDAANIYNETDLEVHNAMGGYEWGFIQSVFNSPLVGKSFLTTPAIYSGIRNNVNWGSIYGLFTPRDTNDIVRVTAPILTANPNPALIGGVVVGLCGTTTVKLYNEGVGNLNITALYLDDAAATDGFNLITPPAVPFTLGTWANQGVTINFCPTVAGNKSTNLIVEYGVGKTLVVPINGTTMLIYNLPFFEDFEAGQPAAWNSLNLQFGTPGNGLATGSSKDYYYGWSWVTPNSPRPIWLITPGINLTGVANPTLTFRFGTYFTANLRVDVSIDYTNWTTLKDWGNHTLGNGVGATYSVDLTAYAGKTVYIRFYSSSANYFGIDDVKVAAPITSPIISVTPVTGNVGGVQLGATGTLAFSVKNIGISILKVKSVTVSGAGFTLTDTNTYPVEVTDGPNTWAYTIGNTASSVDFAVNFTPTEIGVKTGKLTIVYGLYSDQVLEIALTGEGLSCYTAAVATKGQNYAPSQNTWFKYTADKFSIVQVTSCDAHQDLVTNEYAWDTHLYLYSDCAGTLLGDNDDMEAACVYNRASSSVQVTMNAGETIYIFWPLEFPTALYAYDGFYFNINVSYPIDGDVCENAIPLTLPVVNHFGTTVGFNDDYNISPCSPFSNYMDGNDKVYTITTTEEGYLNGTLLGAYGSIHVLDVCPKEELEKFHCKAFTGGPTGGAGFRKKIPAGTYFVIISTWAPPQTVDYLLNMSWESGSAVDNADLMTTMNVYPNPTNGKFTVNISNVEPTDMVLELVNISGQVVYRNEVKAAYSYNEDIDASTFAKGVYYLKVNSANGVKVEKVVVQ